MNIRSPSRTGTQGGQQRARVSGSAGAVGNLPFITDQGGAARGGSGGLTSTEGMAASPGFLVSPQSPQARAHRETWAQARESIYRAGILLYSLASPADPDQRLFQEALALVDNGSEIQAFAMLDRLRVSLGREIHARAQLELRALQERLSQAVTAQDRLAASRTLSDLNALVDKYLQAYGPLPRALAEDVRRITRSSLNLFRDAESNPNGPLNVPSLLGLDDATFVNLRRASCLHCLGLDLDLKAADAVAYGRVGTLSWQVIEYAMDMLRMLAKEAIDVPVFMRLLRDQSGVEQQRIEQLTELGQFADGVPEPEQRRAMAKRTCQLATEELARSTHQASTAYDATRHMPLLADLEGLFGRVASRLEEVIVQEDYREGGARIMEQLVTTRYLLNGMISEMDRLLTDLLSGRGASGADIDLYLDLINRMTPNPAAAAILDEPSEPLPDVPYEEFVDTLFARYAVLESQASLDPIARRRSGAFYRALQEQYGVAYDPAEDSVAVLVADPIRAKMAPALEKLLSSSSRAARRLTLPVGRADKRFLVGEAFYEDGFRRESIFLSVRGAEEGGRPVRFTWPSHMSGQSRAGLMGNALDALTRVARSAAEPLTCLMNIAAISRLVAEGLREMGRDSPFKLDDGTVVHPEGLGALILDVVRNEDGSFRLATTLRVFGIRNLKGVRPDGTSVLINTNPQTFSWAEVHFTLHVSPDVQRINVVGAPQFRHYFDPAAR